MLFYVYIISPTHHIASAHNISVQQYADDTELFIATATFLTAQALLEHCIIDLNAMLSFGRIMEIL